jgi:hypothetical protein
MDGTLKPGKPNGQHFKACVKHYRSADYNLPKILNEMIDNVIKICTECRIEIKLDDNGKIIEIKVSDNNIDGFKDIYKDGESNPFNMGHIRTEHDNDDVTSEFGIGLKAASIAASDHLDVYTKVGDKYWQVMCDFPRMMNEQNVNDSYNPHFIQISKDSYRAYHPFECGSSVILTKIRSQLYGYTTEKELSRYIILI